MNETSSYAYRLRRTLFPLLIAGILILATILVSGSALIRIEDIYVNRIVAGTYGTPDWRVQEMNPLLAQILSLFYRIIPSLNWYGLLLLALLWVASATWLSFAGRTSGGILPVALLIAPIILLSTNAMISTVACALCASAGAFAMMDGLQRQKGGMHTTILGVVLSTFAFSLSTKWGIIISAGALLCYLPGFIRENRMRGFLTGLPVLAIIAAALFGYSSLMYSAPDLASYRENYALYERVQHSDLKEISQDLVQQNTITIYADDEHDHSADDGHDHSADALQNAEDTLLEESDHEEAEATIFDAVNWTINDSSLFFIRYSADAELVNPDTLQKLADISHSTSFNIARLASELFTTIKKPQFLLLIGLFIISSLGLLLTRRRKGLVVLMASVIAFGGHLYALASFYNAYADIAPFYLLAITVIFYHFSGEDVKKWYTDKIKSRMLRIVLSGGVVLVFAAVLGGLFYYTEKNPANDNEYTLQAYNFIVPYVNDNPDMLFVGDNPHDRYKPDTLAAPVRGSDANILAGSYDLYSPRRTELLNRFAIQNPIYDCLNREDIGYISMSYSEYMVMRYAEHYGVYLKPSVDLASQQFISEKVFLLSSYTDEEVQGIVDEKQKELQEQEEQVALWGEALQNLAEQTENAHTDESAVAGENAAVIEPETMPAPSSMTVNTLPTAQPNITNKPTAAPTPIVTTAPATQPVPTTTSVPTPTPIVTGND